jgi:hypothetical protein
VLALVAAGCQDAQQRQAEHAVEQHLRDSGAADYDLKRTHCSRVARMVAQQLATKVFLCKVPIGGPAKCDEFRVTAQKGGGAAIVLTRRNVDCIGPLS